MDKTQFIVPLLEKKGNSTYFLSRPRRFGKSLFISALEQVFKGRKDLFKGLYIYDKIVWEEFPVIRLSLDKIGFTEIPLGQALFKAVSLVGDSYGIALKELTPALAFSELIQKLSEKFQKPVIVLIDEYDKPIINYIEKGDSTQAELNRDILKSFFGILSEGTPIIKSKKWTFRFSLITWDKSLTGI